MNNLFKIKVIIADDHDIYRDGLLMLLSRDPNIEVIAEANNGKTLIELCNKLQTDIVLTDLRMPNFDGIEAIKELSSYIPKIPCIALSTFDSDQLIVTALEAGASGYIIKNSQKGEIIDAIKTVMSGQPYYCQSSSQRLVNLIKKSHYNPYTNKSINSFTEKELSIIKLICEEKSSKEIGEILFMSGRTVEGIRAKILEKMSVKTAAGVAIYAIKNNLFSIEK
jgi:DNA-binding NarL/FixJ family response regulator